jgi:4'-phosphopantetheinyl transferase
MGYGPGKYGGPAYQIGVDVMKVKLPQREHFARFVGSVDSQVILTFFHLQHAV